MDKSTREQLKKLMAQGVTAADIAEIAKELNEDKQKRQEIETAREDLIADMIEYLKVLGVIGKNEDCTNDIKFFRKNFENMEKVFTPTSTTIKKSNKSLDDIFSDFLKTL